MKQLNPFAEYVPSPAPGVHAALFLGPRGSHFGSWVWIKAGDGRLSALRLPDSAPLRQQDFVAWAGQVAGDSRGDLMEVHFPERLEPAPVIYAAPVCPVEGKYGLKSLPVGAFGFEHTNFAEIWPAATLQAIRSFENLLDAEILAALRALNAGRVYDTIRNYNRLIQLPVEQCRNRLQAIRQYSPLLAHVFLTPHYDYDYMGGKPHRWRMHDDGIVNAVDAGSSLLPEMARRYGVQKHVFKTPLMTQRWPNLELSREEVLHVLDGIPAHHKPQTLHELEQARPLFAWLKQHHFTQPPVLRVIGAQCFSEGMLPAMQRLAQRYPAHTLQNCHDFFDALDDTWPGYAASTTPVQDNLPGRNSLAAWLFTHGFWSLLDASVRWHIWVREQFPAIGKSWPALLGELQIDGWHIQELTSAEALAEEGRIMRHCVATRWRNCYQAGARIFHLSAPNGELATAQFDLEIDHNTAPNVEMTYLLEDLQGPENSEVSEACMEISQQIEQQLNQSDQRENRQRAHQYSQRVAMEPAPRVTLDPQSVRMAQVSSFNSAEK
jgi:hypothetical protein